MSSTVKAVIQKSTRTLVQVGEALGIHNLDPESGKIFITDGSGAVGHRVATRLLNVGYPNIRLGATSRDSLSLMNKLGAEIADFDWSDETTYDKALKGVKSVLVAIPYTENWHQHFPAFLKACKHAKVKHIVKLSFYHARVKNDVFHEVPLVRRHGVCDQQLIQFVTPDPPPVEENGEGPGVYMHLHPNMSYTILYASHYMSDPFTFQGAELRSKNKPSTMYGASGNHGVNYVSPNDVAEVVVRVLLSPREHYDKSYTLTGASPIKDQEVASYLSKYLRKPIMYVDQPLHEFSTGLKMSGDPKFMVEDMVAFEKVKTVGAEEDRAFVTNDIESICGHPPESFEGFLRARDMMTDMEAGPRDENDLVPLKEVASN
jgi:uncharacterized protein YbjT (DUF2867 family)